MPCYDMLCTRLLCSEFVCTIKQLTIRCRQLAFTLHLLKYVWHVLELFQIQIIFRDLSHGVYVNLHPSMWRSLSMAGWTIAMLHIIELTTFNITWHHDTELRTMRTVFGHVMGTKSIWTHTCTIHLSSSPNVSQFSSFLVHTVGHIMTRISRNQFS